MRLAATAFAACAVARAAAVRVARARHAHSTTSGRRPAQAPGCDASAENRPKKRKTAQLISLAAHRPHLVPRQAHEAPRDLHGDEKFGKPVAHKVAVWLGAPPGIFDKIVNARLKTRLATFVEGLAL